MAYDPILTERLRDALGGRAGISEKRMMGGVCFMLNGNMAAGVDRTKAGLGRFLFRVGKGNEAEALARRGAYIMEQGGKRMGGFVFVNEGDCDAAELKAWVDLAIAFAGSLPAK